jgi:hypothetical protein
MAECNNVNLPFGLVFQAKSQPCGQGDFLLVCQVPKMPKLFLSFAHSRPCCGAGDLLERFPGDVLCLTGFSIFFSAVFTISQPSCHLSYSIVDG